MKPKNSKERRHSFLKFLLLFLVTVSAIVTAVYFNFKIPVKENDLLKEQAKSIDREVKFQKGFSDEMKNVKKLLDSFSVPSSNKRFISESISKQLVALQTKIPTKDSTNNYDMYFNIVKLKMELLEAKERLYELRDAESTIDKYQETLEDCKDKYKDLERDMDILRAQCAN